MGNTEKGGTSALFLLFLVFLILKLTGTITWSWWFVTMPLWIGFALGMALLAFVGGCLLISGIIFTIWVCGYWIYDNCKK